MELLKIAQYYSNGSISNEKKREFLKRVRVDYCIPDTLPGKQQIQEWAGYTRLHFAVQSCDFDLTVELLNQDFNLVKQGTKDGRTPLHLSYFSYGRMEEKLQLIKTLLSKQVETNKILNPKCNDGISHFHIACMVNHAQAVEFFVKAKVPVDQPIDGKRFKGYTPLHCAIEYSSVKVTEVLLQYGADMHIKNSQGKSCLHLLVERILDKNDFITMEYDSLRLPHKEELEGLQSIVKFVLKANDDVFVDDSGLSAFHVACTLGDKSIVEGYLKRGADLNKPVKSGSKLWPAWTPLHFAACIDIEIMLLLMENGANITMKNLHGQTPLDLFAKRFTPGDIQLIVSIEEKFKDIVLSNNSTKFTNLLEAMKDLDKLGDFLKLKDVNIAVPLDSPIWPSYNLLHLSVSLKERTKELHTDIEDALYFKRINLLLDHGCSVDMKNTNGQTPIHLAFSTNSEATVEKLLNHSEGNVFDRNGISHLHIACVLGHLDAVKRYLSQGTDVNCRVGTSFNWKLTRSLVNVQPNSTPLHLAVTFVQGAVAKYLLGNNADVYARDSLGRTPIHLSMCVDWKCFAAVLLSKAPPNLRESVSSDGLSHLHVAAWANNPKVVEDLLRNGADIDRVVGESSSPWGAGCASEMALLLALNSNWDGGKIRLPSHDVDSSPRVRCAGKTALHLALESKAYEIVDTLLEAGANVYAKDSQGVSVLQHALRDMSSSSAAPFVRLLDSGELEVDSCGMTLLHVACGTFYFDWVEELLGYGADVNARIQDSDKLQGATPLYVLVQETRFLDIDPDRRFAQFSDADLQLQFVRFVKLLLDNGADVTLECCGSTPLHLMYDRIYTKSWREHLNDNEMAIALRAVDLMLKSQKNLDINPINDRGVSHFHIACLRNDVETVTKLLDCGVDVNASIDPFVYEIGGSTSLHFALAYRSKEVAYLLLDKGADVSAEDVYGYKPLHAALKNKFVNLPLIEAMLDRGADINAENFYGETLLYCLLGYGGLTLDALQFFLDRGCSINISNATNKSHRGILGLAMSSAPLTEMPQILKLLVQIPEVHSAIQGGYNIIKSIVSVGKSDGLTVDDYLSAIELFANTDCNLDQNDRTHGITPLNRAASYYNLEAVNALLQLGADINAVDRANCSFFDRYHVHQCQFSDDYDEIGDMSVSKALACHVWKMRLAGLELKEAIVQRLEEVEDEFSLVTLLEQSCQDELAKARESKIYQGLTVKDFLSELGAVAEYPRMGPARQTIVDNYFKHIVNLRREFPEFCGLLAFQYRKALARMKMWQPAKDAITLICKAEVPDLCIEAVLRYFTNSEMKRLIEVVKELV